MSQLAALGNLWHSIQAWLFPMLEDELGELDQKHREKPEGGTTSGTTSTYGPRHSGPSRALCRSHSRKLALRIPAHLMKACHELAEIRECDWRLQRMIRIWLLILQVTDNKGQPTTSLWVWRLQLKDNKWLQPLWENKRQPTTSLRVPNLRLLNKKRQPTTTIWMIVHQHLDLTYLLLLHRRYTLSIWTRRRLPLRLSQATLHSSKASVPRHPTLAILEHWMPMSCLLIFFQSLPSSRLLTRQSQPLSTTGAMSTWSLSRQARTGVLFATR